MNLYVVKIESVAVEQAVVWADSPYEASALVASGVWEDCTVIEQSAPEVISVTAEPDRS